MANLDFYATIDDQRDLLDFLFAETDIVVFEFSSLDNTPLRTFKSRVGLESAYPLGGWRSPLLQLWSPSIMEEPKARKIVMSGLPGSPYRYEPTGAGLIQLYLDGVKDETIYHSHFGHWNEAGARQRSMYEPDECDWKSLAKISGRIQRHIRGKLASAKLYARPVLKNAHSSLRNGMALWWGPEKFGVSAAEVVALPTNKSPGRTREG
jgi:hypothetical protein